MTTDTVPATAPNDLEALLNKLQSLEQRCQTYEQELQKRDEKLQTFTANKSIEMRALMDGLRKWLETLPLKNDELRQQIETGLVHMADRGEENAIFKVFCTASEQSLTRASEMEKLRIENEELKQRVGGGQFAREEDRLSGVKRDAPEADSRPKDIWEDFEMSMRQENGLNTGK